MTIGDRIRQARIENGMTQKDLAEKLGVSYQNISQYERGVKQPKMETIEKIANALGADAYYIRTGDVADLEEAVMTKIRKVDPQLEKVLQKLNTDDRNLFFPTWQNQSLNSWIILNLSTEMKLSPS